MEGTTTRLRKTFKFPADEEDDSDPEAMDEEEQEKLIRNLQTQNQFYNKTYTHILLLLPLVSTLPYLLALFHTTNSPLLSLLSITSLLSTAWLVRNLPPETTGIGFLDTGHASSKSQKESTVVSKDGPLRKWLPTLNIGLCAILLGLGKLASVKGRSGEDWWVLSALPAGVYGVVLVGKYVMGGVDPEAELAELRYEFKGA